MTSRIITANNPHAAIDLQIRHGIFAVTAVRIRFRTALCWCETPRCDVSTIPFTHSGSSPLGKSGGAPCSLFSCFYPHESSHFLKKFLPASKFSNPAKVKNQGDFSAEKSPFSQTTVTQPLTNRGIAVKTRQDRKRPPARPSRHSNGALAALQQGPPCTSKAAPPQPREALTARKQHLFRTKSATKNRPKSPLPKPRKALPAPFHHPAAHFSGRPSPATTTKTAPFGPRNELKRRKIRYRFCTISCQYGQTETFFTPISWPYDKKDVFLHYLPQKSRSPQKTRLRETQ